ncbi:MAG: class I SAM-dependent methyltransferase [Alphaproteobacteria bacterium]|nr:class I SAM-dependent methyltransferase [Alphaproteobacteria bacterium]
MSDAEAAAGTRVLLETFAAAGLPRPGPGRGVFLNAVASPALDAEWRRALVCEQTHKGRHDALARLSCDVRVQAGGAFDAGLVLLTKHKAAALAAVARAAAMVAPGGVLACAGARDAGALSVQKRVGATIALEGQRFAAHQRAFWLRRPEALPPVLADWQAEGALRRVAPDGHVAAPGVFAWDRVDEGSQLLADHLPDELAGRVADFGCGWGYLAAEVLRRRHAVASLDLIDAEWSALEAAKANVADPRARFLWRDLATEGGAGPYDWIVTNPPFHAGVGAEPDLGRAVLVAAARALKPGGGLVLVANRQMAYERTLDAHFAARQVLAETPRYKVLLATEVR